MEGKIGRIGNSGAPGRLGATGSGTTGKDTESIGTAGADRTGTEGNSDRRNIGSPTDGLRR